MIFKHHKGETLVEVMVSLSIIAIAITSAYSAMILANKLVFSNKYRTQALSLVNEGSDIAYNHLKNCGAEGKYTVNVSRDGLVLDSPGIDPVTTSPLPSVEPGSPFGRYITITPRTAADLAVDKIIGVTPSDGYYEITVYVDWTTGSSYQKIQSSTLVGPSS